MDILKLINVFIVSLFILSCENPDDYVFIPEQTPPSSTDTDKPGDEVGNTSADYSKLTAANHPRLLMTDEELEQLKTKVNAGSDKILNTLHKGIMTIANSNAVLNGETIVYQLDASGFRILNQAREAYKRILYLSYAYRMTGDTKYSDAAEKVINTVCDFKDWNARQHFLDPAEMCSAVSIGYDWLYDVLKSETKAKAEKCIKNFAFYPAQNNIWNLNFYKSTDNWNATCNSGLVFGALAIYEKSPAEAKWIIEKAAETLPLFIKACFSPSGCYEEGPSYWKTGVMQAGLIMTNFKENIGTDFGMSKIPGWKETSNCMLFFQGVSDQTFNFSDSDNFVSPAVAQWYFAHEFNDPSVLYNEVSMLNSGEYFASAGSDSERMLPFALLFYNKMDGVVLSDLQKPSARMFSGRSKGSATGVDLCLVHTDWSYGLTDKYLGVKGGKASSSHAHMDSGSFVYDALGVRWSHDLGLQSYTSLETYIKSQGGSLWDMTQNSLRWDVLRLNNKYHSTLTVNDKKHQVEGYGELVEVFDSESEVGGKFDLTEVFGSDVRACYRTAKIVGDDLVIIDEITAPKTARATVDWRMVTKAEVTVSTDYIKLQSGSQTMYLKASSTGPKIEYKTWSANPLTAYDAANPGVTIVGFTGTVTTGQKITFTTTLSPKLKD